MKRKTTKAKPAKPLAAIDWAAKVTKRKPIKPAKAELPVVEWRF